MRDASSLVADIGAMLRHICKKDDIAIDRDTPIDSLGIDSLDFVELIFNIEEKYDVDIEFNANIDGTFPFATVGNAADAVQSLIMQKHAAA